MFVFILRYFAQICTSVVPQKYVHLENIGFLISVSENRKTKHHKIKKTSQLVMSFTFGNF